MALVVQVVLTQEEITSGFSLVTRGVTADGTPAVPKIIRFFLEVLQTIRNGMEKLNINICAHRFHYTPLAGASQPF
jgi:hypothetical protein